jgi:hypothetical protein
MAAGKYSFSIEQGATTSFQVIYKDANGTPVNLSGYHARMQIRETIDSSTIICRLSSSLDADGTGLNLSGSAGTLPLASGSIGVYISAASSSASWPIHSKGIRASSSKTWRERELEARYKILDTKILS